MFMRLRFAVTAMRHLSGTNMLITRMPQLNLDVNDVLSTTMDKGFKTILLLYE